jgi:hypothetical protein
MLELSELAPEIYARVIAKFIAAVELGSNGRLWLREQLGELWREEFNDITVALLFPEVKRDLLQLVAQRAAARDGLYQGSTGLERYVAIDSRLEVVTDLLTTLKLSRRVELAYPDLGIPASLPDPDPGAGPSTQGYLDTGPTGIGAIYAWGFPGGTGSGVRFVDLEAGWNLFHKDLIDAGITVISGQPSSKYNDLNHGTAVLGILVAQDTGDGVIGIAHDLVSARVSSIFDGLKQNIHMALLEALFELRFGDVLLLEEVVSTGMTESPLEMDSAVFDLIRMATAYGIVVIEAAGNTSTDLDCLKDGSGRDIRSLKRSSKDFRDSGAIVVGGSDPLFNSPSGGVIHPRHDFSNYGSRLDCFAWAEGILTTWNSPVLLPPGKLALERLDLDVEVDIFEICPRVITEKPPPLVSALNRFGFTSGASAIIAGVAVCVQGLAQNHLGFRFSPWQLRLLLSDPAHGTWSQHANDKIGVMPDLQKIIDNVLRISVEAGSLYSPMPELSSGATKVSLLMKKSEMPTAQTDFLILPFKVVGCEPQFRRLEVFSRLPLTARVWLEMPGDLADLAGIWRGPEIRSMGADSVFMPVNPNGQSHFRDVVFPEQTSGRLIIQLLPGAQPKSYLIAVRLLTAWEELDRITWRISSDGRA